MTTKTVSVPVDPTVDMIEAGEAALGDNIALNKTGLGGSSAEFVYRAMLKQYADASDPKYVQQAGPVATSSAGTTAPAPELPFVEEVEETKFKKSNK